MESNSEGDYYQSIHDFLLYNISTQPFSAEIAFAILAMVIFLICSAMVSGAEVAFFSLNHRNLVDLREGNEKASTNVLLLLEKPRMLLATILIANNFFNISIIIIAYFISQSLFIFNNAVIEFIINAVLVTFLIVLFGEVIPKVYANYHNVQFAKFISRPILFLRTTFKPVSMILVSSTRIIERKLQKKNGDSITLDEIDHAIDIAADGNSSKEEIQILKGIVKFGNISVKQIMCSRMDIIAVDMETNFKDLVATVVESGYSRIPVFRENLDNIEGILYAKDLLPYLNESDDFNWQSLLRSSFFVPEYKKIEDLLVEFQSRQIHLAVVVDEYGGTAGLITLEDILEEIIGEIRDEFDDPEEEMEYEKIDDYNFIFEGKTLLNDFSRALNVKPDVFDAVKGESDTLAGLILELMQKIPDQNEEITYKQFRFQILSVTKKRIQRVKVTILEDEDFED